MAVLPVDAAEVAFDAQGGGPVRPGWKRTLARLMTEDLPEDVRSAEVTVTVLFRASQILNFLTGGCPEMTFSARCHRSRRTSRGMLPRAGWFFLVVVIDSACGALRGESEHCATAWSNYALRPGRASRV
ncbi:MAG: hypothetical protein AAFV19_03295 [Pseudomonadota bacterium]